MPSIKSVKTSLNMNINTIDCSNGTSPVNISMSTIAGPCHLKCDYNHEYGIYTPNVNNNGNYLSLNYSGKTNPVKYNDEKYTVNEVRIYQPSLHTYNNNKADGEILMIHGGPGKNLIVSIPFIVGVKNDKGSEQLDKLLKESALRVPTKNDAATVSVGNFSLDNFVPDRKGFYSYNGTLPYIPCNGFYSYIVYNIDSALNINKGVLDNIKKILKTTSVDVKSNNVFYNKKGANAKNDDTIYIDCQPVDASGQILVSNVGDNTTGDTGSDSSSKVAGKIGEIVGIIIGSGIVAYLIIWVIKKLLGMSKGKSSSSSSSS
jgi:carbonic anhydrase